MLTLATPRRAEVYNLEGTFLNIKEKSHRYLRRVDAKEDPGPESGLPQCLGAAALTLPLD